MKSTMATQTEAKRRDKPTSLKRKPVGAVRLGAYERLKQAILSQEYRPGQLIGISELARDLGISRTPIREALSVLERDFLVTLIDMRGAQIRPLTVEEIVQLNHVREVIDGLAARLAATLMSDAAIDDFEKQFNALLQDAEFPDPEKQALLSSQLHSAITAACGNAYVQSQWAHLNTAFDRVKRHGWSFWMRSGEKGELSMRRFQEHLEILRALKLRDPQRCEDAARVHISNSSADLLKYLRPPFR
ncbi:MAG: GntR family transcriptional regulator [Ramlibacter sp.]|nr:GntR family transcriptional regulator [Ramlibacter sp.]